MQESTIWGFLHRDLAPERVALVRAHLDTCSECRVVVAAVARSLPAALRDSDETDRDPIDESLVSAHAETIPLDRDPDHDALPIAEGSIVAGKYRVEKLLGRGGMGYVVAARHVQLGTRVALKLLHSRALLHEEARVRFLREARAAAQIESPHVVRVFDVSTLEDGLPFLVMELLEGNDLAEERHLRGTLPVEEAVSYVLQAAHALEDAHASGIVHRDLKPANMFLSGIGPARSLKLLDFGVSKQLRPSLSVDDFRTTEATWLGTPRYMAPEQLTFGHAIDERTDVWGLGVVLHELVAGALPFRGETIEEHCRAVVRGDRIGLDEARPGVPPRLARVVARCLATEPKDRYASVAELAKDLSRYTEDEASVDAPDPAHGVAPPVSVAPPPRRGRGRVMAFGAFAAAVVLGVALLLHGASSSSQAAPTAASPAPSPTPASEPPVSAAADPVVSPDSPSALSARAAPGRAPRTTPRRNAEFGKRR